jgi:hypothetical protein
MSKGQSKKMSVLEQFANIGLGMIIALITQIITFPLFGLEVTFGDNLAILGIFTVVSFIRGYCFRRGIRRYQHRSADDEETILWAHRSCPCTLPVELERLAKGQP